MFSNLQTFHNYSLIFFKILLQEMLPDSQISNTSLKFEHGKCMGENKTDAIPRLRKNEYQIKRNHYNSVFDKLQQTFPQWKNPLNF